jgi:hypothetical protein
VAPPELAARRLSATWRESGEKTVLLTWGDDEEENAVGHLPFSTFNAIVSTLTKKLKQERVYFVHFYGILFLSRLNPYLFRSLICIIIYKLKSCVFR